MIIVEMTHGAAVKTRGERIAALERDVAELTVVVAKQHDLLSRLAIATLRLQDLAADDSLPGEQPLVPDVMGRPC